jgi:hypothetical protein
VGSHLGAEALADPELASDGALRMSLFDERDLWLRSRIRPTPASG